MQNTELSKQFQTTRPLRGVLLVLAAVLVFACMDSTGKFLFENYPIPMVQSARYVVNLALVAGVFGPREGKALFKVERTALVWLRGLSLAFGTLTASLALKSMPVAETTALIYLAPFGVLLLSGPLLGERVRWFGWAATAVAFLGLICIVRPGSGLAPMGIFWALLCACFTVVYHTLSRLLAKTETTPALLFYTALAGTIFFFVQLPWNFGAWPQSTLDISLFIAIGCLGMLGHFLFTAAYREAPLSLLTPVNYMHLAWAVLLGWLIFNHVPDALTFIGIALVALSGAGNALLSHFSNSQITALEPEEV